MPSIWEAGKRWLLSAQWVCRTPQIIARRFVPGQECEEAAAVANRFSNGRFQESQKIDWQTGFGRFIEKDWTG